MHDQFSVRPAAPGDVTSIHRFICSLEKETFDFELFTACYLENIAAANHIYLIAEDQEQAVAGYISCHGQLLLHHLGWVYEIQECFVEERYRKTGVGKLLLHHLEQIVAARKAIQLEVTANIIRADALLFYTACGFKKTHHKFVKQGATFVRI